jgi:hypothetical protein
MEVKERGFGGGRFGCLLLREEGDTVLGRSTSVVRNTSAPTVRALIMFFVMISLLKLVWET